MQLEPFTRPAEAYAPSEPVSTCDPFPKPGVVAFRGWILAEYSGRDGGIERACDVGASSPHHEGRAWDWFPPDRATADRVIACLLANGGELARRAGLRNVIYYERTWNAGRAAAGSDGWSRYKYADSASDTQAHRDHVHFAFSWAGARGQTSLFDVIGGSTAELGQVATVEQVIVPAVRTPVSFAELRSALLVAHQKAGLGDPSPGRLRLAWSMVGHETDQTRAMWNHNAGNIACTSGSAMCHKLNVADPTREPSYYRSYSTLVHGAADFWSLLARKYPAALEAFDRNDTYGGARELKKAGYFGQAASDYANGLERHGRVYDRAFGVGGDGGSVLPALLVLGVLGGAVYYYS